MSLASDDDAELGLRLAQVKTQIAQAARAADRDPDSVRLVVITKAAPASIFDGLARLGVRDVGESRVVAAEQRMAGHEDAFRWHLVGHLQSNKVRRAVARFDVFHGVDSLELLQRIERVAGELERRPECLLQINVSGEQTKHGLTPASLPEIMSAAAELRHARVTGLMTMAPRLSDPAEVRSVFAGLAALARAQQPPPTLSELSMGMSDDFGLAVQEGATLIRVGRRIVAPPDMG